MHNIAEELEQIKRRLSTTYTHLIDDLIETVRQISLKNSIVPPLKSDVPLSYRSGCNNVVEIGSKVTPIEGIVTGDTLYDLQTGYEIKFFINNIKLYYYDNSR